MRHCDSQKSQHKPTARSGWTKQKYVNNDVQIEPYGVHDEC